MQSPVLIGGLGLLFSLLFVLSAAADCVDYGDYFHLEASLPLPGSALGIAVAGDFAYLAQGACPSGDSGLDIVDITNPAAPIAMGRVQLPTWCNHVAVSGDYAYVTEEGYAQETPALQVVNVADPRSPEAEGIIGLPPGAGNLAVSGSHVFVANGSYGLLIFDVSDPAHPRRKGRLETAGSASGVAFRPGMPASRPTHAYVADGIGGLLVVELSDLRQPRIVGTAVLGEWVAAMDVALSGDFAYIATGGEGLYVVDVSVPTQPHVIGHVDTPGSSLGVAVSGSRAYLADDAHGLHIIDVSDPATPRLLGGVNCGYMYGCCVVGHFAFLAAYQRGLQVIDVAGDASVQPLGSASTPGQAQGLAVSGDHAFFGCGQQGLQVIDIADPANPTIVGSLNTPGWAKQPVLMGQCVFLPDGGSVIRVIDVSDPTAPEQATRIDTYRDVAAVAVDHRYLYVSEDDFFEIYDLIDPRDPQWASNWQGMDEGAIAVSDGFAYVGGWNVLQVVSVADPYRPAVVGELPLHATVALAAAGSYVYAAVEYPCRLCIVDVSIPTAPVLVSSVASSSSVTGVTLSGNHVYLTSYEGVRIIDVEDPRHPQMVGGGDTFDLANDVVVANDLAYLSVFGTGYFSGLVIFPSQCQYEGLLEASAGSEALPARGIAVQVAPSPVRAGAAVSISLAADSQVRADIYDLAGRRVRILNHAMLRNGAASFYWDGRDGHDRQVAAGVYLVRVRTEAGEGSARIVMLR